MLTVSIRKERAIRSRELLLGFGAECGSLKGKIHHLSSLRSYVFSLKAAWYWGVISLVGLITFSVFIVAEDSYPLVCTRYLLGVFVLWLPGYVLAKAVLIESNLDLTERVVLNVGMSIALVFGISLVVNFLPRGLDIVSPTLSLLAVTIAFATTDIIRQYIAHVADQQDSSG